MSKDLADHHGFNLTITILQPSFRKFDLIMAIITILLTCLCFTFNIIIFYAFWGMRKSSNALIFLNLAAVDVVLSLLVMPYSIIILFTRTVDFHSTAFDVFCAATGFVFEVTVFSTVGFIFLASADRYLGVYNPVFHRKHLCRRNLLKLVISIWIVSPVLVILWVVSWVLSSRRKHIYTNLSVFTTCMGEYWWRHDNHILGNAPLYFTGGILLVLMVIIVVSNLAVLKQLFRTRPSGIVNVQNQNCDTATRRRRNNLCSRAPNIDSSAFPTANLEASEQLKRISRAEQEVEKKDRIFQTDSTGDITGINITAIMKLYISSTRSRKKSNKSLNKTTRGLSRELDSEATDSSGDDDESRDEVICERLVSGAPCEPGLDSLNEEDEISLGYSNDDEDNEEMEKSITLTSLEDEDTDEKDCVVEVLDDLSDEEDETSGETSGLPPDQAIWKVIKFVVALKQTTRRRRRHELYGGATSSDSYYNDNCNVPSITRSISDSELDYMSHRSSTDLKCKSLTGFKARKISENLYGDRQKGSQKSSTSYLANSITSSNLKFSSTAKLPSTESSTNNLSSLFNAITSFRRRSKDTKDKSLLRDRLSKEESFLIKEKIDALDSDASSEMDYRPKHSRSGLISWRTLALVSKFKQKLLTTRQLPYENLSPPIVISADNDPPLLKESDSRERAPPPEAELPPTDVSVTLSRGSIVLKTINEEDDNSVGRRERVSSTKASTTSQFSCDAKRSSVSRTKSLDSISCSQPPIKRRRGGFIFKQEPPTPLGHNPSPDSLLERNTNSRASNTYVQNAAQALRRRMRASSVYKMGGAGGRRNSVSISSVAQMVYNFNRHVQKKKKEIRAAKTIIILVFYYIITLLFFVISFYYVSMSSDRERVSLPYWLTFYPYIIYFNALFNPIIHFWRNARVRNTVLRIICTRRVNETFRRWSLRGGRNCCCF